MTGARHLRVVARPRPAQPQIDFCGHCGERPDPGAPSTRVCASCGLGLLLVADADVAPAPGEAFVVVDHALAVCALSERAEELLAVTEPDAVDRRVTEFLVQADAEGPRAEALIGELLQAGGGAPARMVLRPADEYGVLLFARIGVCGPRRSALIVLADA